MRQPSSFLLQSPSTSSTNERSRSYALKGVTGEATMDNLTEVQTVVVGVDGSVDMTLLEKQLVV